MSNGNARRWAETSDVIPMFPTLVRKIMLVFPAYLRHSVDANPSNEERISISFNIMFSSFTENLNKPLCERRTRRPGHLRLPESLPVRP
jgi:hypothetical protein